MADPEELEELPRAFLGLGVDEKTLVSVLGKSHWEQRRDLRKGALDFFIEDERQFERWDDRYILQLRNEFLRFKDAIVLWMMHPWERDARLLKESLHKGTDNYTVLVEVACTRSSEELLGARRAYHSLFDRSIEEDVVRYVQPPYTKLLLGLVSAYRYEGSKLHEETVQSEANVIWEAIQQVGDGKILMEDDEIVRILSIRSKHHLKAVYEHYKEISGNDLDDDLEVDDFMKETALCLCKPRKYFSKVLAASLEQSADEVGKEGLTRIVVTRADNDIKEISEKFCEKYEVELRDKIEEATNGNYRDLLLTLISRGD